MNCFKFTYMKLLRALFFLFIFCFCMFCDTNAQTSNDSLIREAIVYNGDTISLRTLENIFFYSKMNEARMNANAKYNRLRNAVYVCYPYARRAGVVLNDINDKIINIQEKSVRKKYIQSREKELKKEFTDPLSNLSVYQGKVLMKLINRETGNNCYDIIKEYRGGFTARMYQTVAFFFNSNLRQSYEAEKDDAVMEKLVLEVQRMYGYREQRKMASLN